MDEIISKKGLLQYKRVSSCRCTLNYLHPNALEASSPNLFLMVEILKDVSFRVLPITPTDAKKMIEETKSYPILNGARGTPPLDQTSIRKLLLLCSEITEAYPEIEEMDLNPVIVYERGLGIVDARVILKTDDGGQMTEVR